MSDSPEAGDRLVDASRRITGSRSSIEIIALATEALTDLTGALHVQFIDPTVPVGPMAPGSLQQEVRGHGRALGRFELVFAPDAGAADNRPLVDLLSLIATVAGTALATADQVEPARAPTNDRRSEPRGDRRRMDRDFIDHTRSGQVGFIVLRVLGAGQSDAEVEASVVAAAAIVDQVIRQNDVSYLSAPGELSILLPGATKPEAAMAADRIRHSLTDAWMDRTIEVDNDPTGETDMYLAGGVTAGRHEDPQRLAERALGALDEALEMGPNTIVTDLGS